MGEKKCPQCSTVNEPEYIYCKNCGALLSSDRNAPFSEKEPINNDTYNYSSAPESATEDYTVSGIPASEISVFIGKNANKFLPEFLKMEVTGSKASWCWPVAVLSFFFGPIGAAVWYFYRKMYKKALLFTAIGMLLFILQYLFSFGVTASSVVELLSSYVQSNYVSFFDFLKSRGSLDVLYGFAVTYILETIELVFAVFISIFAKYHYKNHCIDKIKGFRLTYADPRFYRFGLASVGGVSAGMAVIAVFCYIFISSVEPLFAFLQKLIF